jgi:SAM-dependent methyltransferase
MSGPVRVAPQESGPAPASETSAHTGPNGSAESLARYYDLDLLDDPGDRPFYEAVARRVEGLVLELGVGSGRLAVPLALAGHAVVGVDGDPAMLARAAAAWERRRGRRPADRLRLIAGDLTDLRLPERFGLILIALNTLLLLDPDRQAAAFGTIAAHLAPRGLAIVDVLLPGADDLARYDGRLLLEWVRDDAETGERVIKLAAATHDPALATVDLTQVFDASAREGGPVRRIVRVDRLHLVTARELVGLAEGAGLQVESLAGDHEGTPFGAGSGRVVLTARAV